MLLQGLFANILHMPYQPQHIYHIFNQGNNKQTIFYSHKNYDLFMQKMKTHINPLVDILAYCLMPNHFHWLVCVKDEGCSLSDMKKPGIHVDSNVVHFQQKLSAAIAVLLRSYTRAINNQEGRSGSLFRARTKVENGQINFSAVGKQNQNLHKAGTSLSGHEYSGYIADYWKICLDYIHLNPVRAGLVNRPSEYKYSSAREYRLDSYEIGLCNVAMARRLGLTKEMLI